MRLSPQQQTVLRLLRVAGPVGVHSLTLRREHSVGDPARRINDLEEKGCRIEHIPERKGNTNGTRYVLVGGPVEVARSQSAGDPGGPHTRSPDAASLLPTRRPGHPVAPVGKGFDGLSEGAPEGDSDAGCPEIGRRPRDPLAEPKDGRPRVAPATTTKQWMTRPDDRKGWQLVKDWDKEWRWELHEPVEPQTVLEVAA